MATGKFIISLDFELHWGVAELWDLNLKKDYFDATRKSIPMVLALFEKYHIHATWATVGFLFAKNKAQLLAFCPQKRPTYTNDTLSYYKLIDDNQVGEDEKEDPYHYAPSLIDLIVKTPHQELATHTFAHYYCNEAGQNKEQFEADIQAVQRIAKENFDIELKSLVFPRNQFNKEYLEVAKKNGIKVFRSNPNVWFWQNNYGKLTPLLRALDTLFAISKPLSYKSSEVIISNGITELPASRFLRPFTPKEKSIRKRKLRRILEEMKFAAAHNELYHLWWHPHNFGDAVQENLEDLEIILRHYTALHLEYGFESKSMATFLTN